MKVPAALNEDAEPSKLGSIVTTVTWLRERRLNSGRIDDLAVIGRAQLVPTPCALFLKSLRNPARDFEEAGIRQAIYTQKARWPLASLLRRCL